MKELYNKFRNLPFSVKCSIIFLCIIIWASIIAFPFDTLMVLGIAGTVASFIRIITYLVEGK